MTKLNIKESNEDLNLTWGRIRGISRQYLINTGNKKFDRLNLLIEKFNKDLEEVDLVKTIKL